MDMTRNHPFERLEEFVNQFSMTPHTRMESRAVNVDDRGDEVTISVDIPGFSEDELEVWHTEDTLHISAEKESGDEHRTHRSEFKKTVPLSKSRSWDWENANAEYNNGVLTITIPKPETESSENRIPIE